MRTDRPYASLSFAIRVRTLVAVALSLLAGGCSGWDSVMAASYGASTAAPAAGGAAVTTGSVIAGPAGLFVSISLGTDAANIMAAATGAAIYAAMLQESGEWRPWLGPPMLEGRTVNEQDCTKPITDTQANLKCK